MTRFVKSFSKWRGFLQSLPSKVKQVIASYEEIAAPITWWGTHNRHTITKLAQLGNVASIQGFTYAVQRFPLSSETNRQTKKHFCRALEKEYFWVHYFPHEHSEEKQRGKLPGS